MKKILIIDDEINIGLLLSKFLTRNGFEVKTATSGAAGLTLLSKEAFNLILCDFRLEDTDGREVLKKVKASYPQVGVIIVTGYSDIKLAVELIKMGAYDYITKPLYPDEILNTINKALEMQDALAAVEEAAKAPADRKEKTSQPDNQETFIAGTSATSRELLRQIELVAPTNYSIILTGESGTGKESVARLIHESSSRRDKPFIPMDCGSLTKELAGSEFFGHEKGSFTGALFTKIGHFEMANGGTLFLDEIGNLSYEIQAALLRTVQERKVKRVGGNKEIEVDVRIIVATNENLQEAIQKGRFREDLYHRLNEFSVHLPPLRHRDNDILIFSEKFLSMSNAELNKNIEGFSDEVVEALLNYKWPGNIRELKNVIRRATLLTEGRTIQIKAIPLEISNYSKVRRLEAESLTEKKDSRNLKDAALEAEYETIMKVLREVNFNKTKAAKILNIDRKTLYNKMKAIEIS